MMDLNNASLESKYRYKAPLDKPVFGVNYLGRFGDNYHGRLSEAVF